MFFSVTDRTSQLSLSYREGPFFCDIFTSLSFGHHVVHTLDGLCFYCCSMLL